MNEPADPAVTGARIPERQIVNLPDPFQDEPTRFVGMAVEKVQPTPTAEQREAAEGWLSSAPISNDVGFALAQLLATREAAVRQATIEECRDALEDLA